MNKFCSIFSQLLQLFPRNEFHQAVKKLLPSPPPLASPAWANPGPFSSGPPPLPLNTGGKQGQLNPLEFPPPPLPPLFYPFPPGT